MLEQKIAELIDGQKALTAAVRDLATVIANPQATVDAGPLTSDDLAAQMQSVAEVGAVAAVAPAPSADQIATMANTAPGAGSDSPVQTTSPVVDQAGTAELLKAEIGKVAQLIQDAPGGMEAMRPIFVKFGSVQFKKLPDEHLRPALTDLQNLLAQLEAQSGQPGMVG